MADYVDYTCPTPGLWPYVFAVQYFVLIKLVLWTLLFAMFSDTQGVAENDSLYTWKFERYQFVAEYSRVPPLPPPLNIFYFLWRALAYMMKCCRVKKIEIKKDSTKSTFAAASHEYSYWRHLIQNYELQKCSAEMEEEYNKDKLNMLSELNENIKHMEEVIHKGSSQISELAAEVSFTRLCVRTNKYRKYREGTEQLLTIHELSRKSPYPGTKIERFPVPNKYVPWEVKWFNYEPEHFSSARSEYPENLQPYVDEDTFLGHSARGKLVASRGIRWNIEYTDTAGVYHGRDSWISGFDGEPLIYKLYDGLPQNPMGRTGIHGRGSLLSWGPNHYIFIIITRWSSSTHKDGLEFIHTWHGRRSNILLPGGYVTNENRYYVIQSFFQTSEAKVWETESDMLQFFESYALDVPEVKPNVKSVLLHRGYMDDPLNTDQSWKEVEAWHVHYYTSVRRNICIRPHMAWALVTEDVFTLLPVGEAKLLQQVLDSLNVSLF